MQRWREISTSMMDLEEGRFTTLYYENPDRLRDGAMVWGHMAAWVMPPRMQAQCHGLSCGTALSPSAICAASRLCFHCLGLSLGTGHN